MPFFDPVTGEYVNDPTLMPAVANAPAPGGLEGALGQGLGQGLVPPEFVAPVAPDMPVAQPGLAPMSTSTKQSIGVKQSQSGVDLGVADDIDRFATSTANKNSKGARAELDKLTGGLVKGSQQRGQTSAAAQGAINEATEAATQAEMASSKDLAAFHAKQVHAEQQAQVTARAEVDSAKAVLQEQIAKTAAMGVDSDRLMKNAGATGRLGFAAAAFAEGFLGAKGIKVNVTQNIRARIDDDINEQIQDLQNARETTAQFRQLYDMARQESIDDTEARGRLRTMYFEVAKQEVLQRTLTAKSQLEQAQGQKALADITNAQSKEVDGLMSHRYSEGQRIAQQEKENAARAAALAHQKAELEFRKDEADSNRKAAADAAGKEAQDDIIGRAIIATDAEGNNRVIGVMRRGYDQKTQADLQKRANAATKMSRDITKIMGDLAADKPGLFSGSGTLATAFGSPESQAYKARARRAAREYIKEISGATVTDKEADDYLNSILPIDAKWKRTDVKGIMKQFQSDLLDNTRRDISGYTEEVPDEVLQQIPGGQKNNLGQADEVISDAETASAPVDTAEDKILQQATQPVTAKERRWLEANESASAGGGPAILKSSGDSTVEGVRKERRRALEKMANLAMQGKTDQFAMLKDLSLQTDYPHQAMAIRLVRDIEAARERGLVGQGTFQSGSGEDVTLPVVGL